MLSLERDVSYDWNSAELYGSNASPRIASTSVPYCSKEKIALETIRLSTRELGEVGGETFFFSVSVDDELSNESVDPTRISRVGG